MSSPDITAEDIAAVNAALHTPVLSIGPQTRHEVPSFRESPSVSGIDAFEQAAAESVGAKFGIGVNSGTAGLRLSGMVQ